MLTTSQRQTVITSVEKKGRDKRYIKNWRPVSLHNADAKIISNVMANRLKKVIETLISSDQTTYVPGRFNGESSRLVSDLIEYTNIHNLPGGTNPRPRPYDPHDSDPATLYLRPYDPIHDPTTLR